MSELIKKYGQFIFAFIFLVYFSFTLEKAFDFSQEVVIATILTLILYMQSIGVLLYFYYKHGKPRLQDWMRLVLFIMLPLNFMSLVNHADSMVIPFNIKSISLDLSIEPMIALIFTYMALDMAYIINNSFNKKRSRLNINYNIKRKNLVFIVLVVATVLKGYLLIAGFAGYGSSIENTTGFMSFINQLVRMLNPFALILSAYIIFIENSTNKIYKRIFYFIIPIQVLLGLMSGMKENTIEPLLYIGVVYLIAGKEIPKKVIALFIFFAILLYPFMNSYRNIVNDPYLDTGNHALNMALAVNSVINDPLEDLFGSGAENYSARGAMFPYLQYAIEIEPEWDYYKYMTRYVAIPFTWLVPRAIWVDKPRSDTGQILNAKIIGKITANSVTPTTVGWAYLEGGLFFVVFAFVLLGLLFEIVDRFGYRSYYKNPMVIIFYTILLHHAIKPEWDIYFLLASMPQIYVMNLIFLKLIGIQKNRTYVEYKERGYLNELCASR